MPNPSLLIPCKHFNGKCVCEKRKKKFLFIEWIPECVKIECRMPCEFFELDAPPAPVAPVVPPTPVVPVKKTKRTTTKKRSSKK